MKVGDRVKIRVGSLAGEEGEITRRSAHIPGTWWVKVENPAYPISENDMELIPIQIGDHVKVVWAYPNGRVHTGSTDITGFEGVVKAKLKADAREYEVHLENGTGKPVVTWLRQDELVIIERSPEGYGAWS